MMRGSPYKWDQDAGLFEPRARSISGGCVSAYAANGAAERERMLEQQAHAQAAREPVPLLSLKAARRCVPIVVYPRTGIDANGHVAVREGGTT